ncbi:MAG: c-type cytochrome [Caldilineaceae bacterium]
MRKPWYSWLYVRSPIMKILLGVLAVGVSFAGLLAQGYFEPKRMEAQTANWHGRAVEKGAEIFSSNCYTCHGADGKGLPGVAPALHSRYFFTQRMKDVGWSGSLHDYIALTVAAGRPSKTKSQWAQVMPTWGNRYGGPMRDDQVEQVTQFVLNWQEDAMKQDWGTPVITGTTSLTGTAGVTGTKAVSAPVNLDPFQPFQDAPSKAAKDTVTYTVGTLGAAAVGTVVMTATTPAPAAGGAAATTAGTPPQELYVSMGCSGCHKIDQDQTDANIGQPGPNQGNLYKTAATRVSGQDAETYVYNSITDPSAFVVPGYVDGIMPKNFKDRMSEAEIRSLVKWILDPNRKK